MTIGRQFSCAAATRGDALPLVDAGDTPASAHQNRRVGRRLTRLCAIPDDNRVVRAECSEAHHEFALDGR